MRTSTRTEDREPAAHRPNSSIPRQYVIGIDPGLRGGVALVSVRTLRCLEVISTPVHRSKSKLNYDVHGMFHALQRFVGRCAKYDNAVVLAVLEQQHAMPLQGVTSMFMTGYGFGLWHGLLVSLQMPLMIIRAVEWQKMVLKGVGLVRSAKSSTGTNKADTKARSIVRAQQLFPGIQLVPERSRNPSDGRSDAALIAYYGSMYLRGKLS